MKSIHKHEEWEWCTVYGCFPFGNLNLAKWETSTWQNSQANNIPYIYHTRAPINLKILNDIKWETIERSPPEPINHYDWPIKGSDVHLLVLLEIMCIYAGSNFKLSFLICPFGNQVYICRFKLRTQFHNMSIWKSCADMQVQTSNSVSQYVLLEIMCRYAGSNFKLSFTICRGWTSFIVHYITAIGDALIIMLSKQTLWLRDQDKAKVVHFTRAWWSSSSSWPNYIICFWGENRLGG